MKKSLLNVAIMLTRYFFIGFLVQFIAFNTLFGENVNAQLNDTISGNFNTISVKTLLSLIRQKTGVSFIYDSRDVNVNDVVLVHIGCSVSTAGNLMDSLSKKFGWSFKKIGNTITIKSKGSDKKPFALPYLPSTKTKSITVIKAGPVGTMLRISVKDKDVSGLVTDSSGSPLPGVTVYVKNNRSIGTTTDMHGRFILRVSDNATLVFSMIGFQSREESVGQSDVINVKLLPSSTQLDETVVVAFGRKQLKEATVGSVVTVTGKDLKTPSSNLTTALAGRIAGLISFQRSGEPGQDNADFFIRGIGTFGQGNSPLILVDNIEMSATDLARMQPDDIASFSVLKDASATSMYGARAANGVIFITTKEGKEGRVKLSLRSEVSMSTPTKEIQTIDPITYMNLYDEAQLTRDPLAAPKYSQNQIDHTIAGDNPYVYPKVNWKKMLIKRHAITQRNNMSISGGGKIAQYYVAGTYNVDNGILKVDKRNNFNNNIKLKTYQLRSNITINVTPTTKATVRLYGNFDEYNGPIPGGAAIYQEILKTSPAAYPAYYLPDAANKSTQHILFGNYDDGSGNQYLNPYSDLVKGYKTYSQSKMLAQLELNQKFDFITKGLDARLILSTDRYSYFDATRAYKPYYYNIGSYTRATDAYTLNWLNQSDTPTEYLNYNASSPSVSTHLYMLLGADYSRSWGKHQVGGSLVSTVEQTQKPQPGTSLQQSLPHRNMGLSGLLTYNYNRQYFVEFSFGYNGSERFSEDKRFGFFPTIGGAWVVSNERFWKDMGISGFLTKLKFRGSYGLVGNDAIGAPTDRFFYLSEVNMDNPTYGYSTGYNNGEYHRDGISISRYENFAITWEKSYQTDLAVELTILNKLNITADLYRQKRTNILQTRTDIPITMGLATIPTANVGEAESDGIDLSMDYNQSFGNNWWIQGRANFTLSGGKYLKYEEPEYPDNEKYRYIEGSYLNVQRGYIAERLFIDNKDVFDSPTQNFGIYGAGDIKYRDVNGDGQITGADMVPLGYPTVPQIIYGFGFSVGHKNFDLSLFFQGLGRESFWINADATSPFINTNAANKPISQTRFGENAMLKAYGDSYWSEDNRDIYAIWPRLSTTKIANNTVTSTWFMRDGSFLRLKSAEIGYSLPDKLVQRWKMDNLRIYFNGTNLLCLSKFKLWDPEMGGNGLGYPIQRVFNLGININF